MHHHAENFTKEVGRMWILFCITIGVVHPVKDRISSRVQVGRTLRNPCKNVKEFLPEGIHGKHFMRGVAMKKEGLAEK